MTMSGRHYWFYGKPKNKILAVAHLDTVFIEHDGSIPSNQNFGVSVDRYGNDIVYSPSLDDRLGAYIIMDYLPSMGFEFDVLLTDDEEMGQSTAEFFTTDKQYNWIIEFDRAGIDVACYQYKDSYTDGLLEEIGVTPSHGSFTDICELYDFNAKGFNWGVGYHSQHTKNCHVKLHEWQYMMEAFTEFYKLYRDTHMPHTKKVYKYRRYNGGTYYGNWDNWDNSQWDDYAYGYNYEKDEIDDDTKPLNDKKTHILEDQYEEILARDDYYNKPSKTYSDSITCPMCDRAFVDNNNFESIVDGDYGVCLECVVAIDSFSDLKGSHNE